MNLDGASRQLFQACLNGNLLGIDIYTFDLGASLAINKSNHITVNLAGVLPLKPWTHLVVQANHMAQGALSVYVNGVLLPAVTGNPPAGCGWELSGVNPVLPENTTTLKHVRIYNRLMTGQEIAANALVDCFSIAEAYRPTLTPSLWARFNTPDPGDPTTISGAGSFETQHAPIYPHHRLASSYAYNSANQAVRQKTPDGGLSHFWYDKISRLIASQNEEQRDPANPLDDDGRYSYTKYDALGRIIEVGEKSGYTTGLPAPGFLSQSEITDFYTDVNATNTQLTQTIYDIVPPPVSGLTPNFTGSNLRKRVSATYYREQEGGAVSQASFYGYDIAGNVKNLWQHVQGIGFKSLQYEYDLASGKVNFISYQDGANDRFYYQYKYDRDIRLVEALTGTEADILPQGSELLNEKTNVTYQYYLHGPLARMELGHDKVQGVDYAYTLQGWLKGINGHRLNAAQEMGNDGVANTDRATIARDVMAYTLGYYQGDYQPIGAGSATAFPMQFSTQSADITGHDLFNGNISHTTVALSKFRNGDPVGYSYRYDQLNRLKEMRRHGLAANTTTWNSSSISDKFKESIVYDGNGNIKTYLRNGAGETGMPLAMDNLTYVYNTAIDPVSGNPYLVNNRLMQVTDQVASANYSQALNGTEDLDGQAANNYHYDKIGNLVKDVKENIDRIEWTVYGKIKKITKGNGDIIAYTYDAAGNRASKSVTESSQTTITWYVRDAQGNSLALYSDKQGGQSGMWWKEQSLYGSSRLGIWAPEINISSVNGTSEWSVAGKTVYELSNHLGNVMATITDKKTAHDPGNGIYYNAEVVSATDYYPFGMQMPGRNWSSSTYRYGFNGQEKSNEIKGEGNSYTALFWEYDPRVGRRWNVDSKPNVSISGYAAFLNSPILVVDPFGDTTYRFNQKDGKYIGMYDLDAVGQRGSYGAMKTIGRGKDKQEVWDGQYFNFADPVNDPKDIANGTINQLIFVSNDDMTDILTSQGAFNYDDKDKLWTFYNNSTGGQSFDYSYSVIPGKYGEQGASSNPLIRPSSVLFLPEGDYTAHNHMNFGNYLWAASGYTLGFEISTLQLGGHANSILNPDKNGYKRQWDSKDDQNSIKLGAFHAIQHKYRAIIEARNQAELKKK
ncbi:MAG TPA: hypothetical protein PK339_11580 [Flavitalea sp.]|nr:hypothetical protein [Flavitalea sp.]